MLPGSSDSACLHVTTDLQSFGMIVTAEPYSAVRQPSDVVVMENEVRPDTIGHIELVQAKYELMPRGEYTYMKPVDLKRVNEDGPKLSMDEYEKLLEVYQAQNAVQIARSAGADQYAADTFIKAEQLLRTAQDFPSTESGSEHSSDGGAPGGADGRGRSRYSDAAQTVGTVGAGPGTNESGTGAAR